jgi:hypothetical protein
VDKEANAQNISSTQQWIKDARSWREEDIANSTRQEKEQSLRQYQCLLSWLDMNEAQQDEILQSLSNACRMGTCEWIVRKPSMKDWMRRQREHAFIWLKGKPGSGMFSQ